MRRRTTITIDERIWRRFRAVVVLQGTDTSEILEELCEVYSNAHEADARRSVEPLEDPRP